MAPILGEISGLVCDLEAKTSQNYCFCNTNAQIGSVRSCSNGLKFGMNIGIYMGQILGYENLVVPDTKRGLLGSEKSSSIVASGFSHF